MAFSTFEYKELCKVVIRHGYLLDNGADDFDSLTANEQKTALNNFQFTEMVNIVPLPYTQQLLKDLQSRVIFDNQGFRLVAKTAEAGSKPLIDFADNETFLFAIKLKHPYFPAITNITDSRKQLMLFANVKPDELDEWSDFVPLEADSQYADDTFLLLEPDSDILKAAWADTSLATGLLGFIYLRTKGNSASLDLLEANGDIKATPPVFKIHFETRRTYWKYIKRGADFMVKTNKTFPLTKKGFIEIDTTNDFDTPLDPPESGYFYPNPSLENFEFTPTKTYSVIFI